MMNTQTTVEQPTHSRTTAPCRHKQGRREARGEGNDESAHTHTHTHTDTHTEREGEGNGEEREEGSDRVKAREGHQSQNYMCNFILQT